MSNNYKSTNSPDLTLTAVSPNTAATKVVNNIANIRPELVRTFDHDQEQGHQQRVFHERRSGVTG